MTPERARQIIDSTKDLSGGFMPSPKYTAEEHQEITDVWCKMPGNTSFMDALHRIANGRGMWTHDCDKCVFLGTHNNHDLYYCEIDKPYTLIARFSDEGQDYKSGACFEGHIPEITEAARIARSRGLIK